MTTPLNWGILAAGWIAKAFAKGVQHSKTGKLLAIASRSQDKANAFMEKNKNAGVIAVSGPVIYVASVKEEKD